MMNLQEEKTCVLIKPDGVKRGLIGETIKRIEQRGLKIIALEMFWATKNQVDRHYPRDRSWIERLGRKTLKNYQANNLDPVKELGGKDPIKIGRSVRKWLIEYLVSGPMVKIVVGGIHAINMVRKIVGSTMPSEAEMGTIRGDFSVDDAAIANQNKRSIRNLVHASENEKEAKHEIMFWFSPEGIHDYKRAEEDIMF